MDNLIKVKCVNQCLSGLGCSVHVLFVFFSGC